MIGAQHQSGLHHKRDFYSNIAGRATAACHLVSSEVRCLRCRLFESRKVATSGLQ
jgi:hypothetical protein